MEIKDNPTEEEIEEAKNMVILMLEDLESEEEEARETSATFLELSVDYQVRPYRILGAVVEFIEKFKEESYTRKNLKKLFEKWGIVEIFKGERGIEKKVKEDKLRYIG